MTDSEMRQRLAEAMGWMDLRAGAVRTLSGVFPEQNILVRTEVPDPLERDQDAALLRAWCVGKGWYVVIRHDGCPIDRANVCLTLHDPEGLKKPTIMGAYSVMAADEPDPIRRERLALCRAVLQAIEIGG